MSSQELNNNNIAQCVKYLPQLSDKNQTILIKECGKLDKLKLLLSYKLNTDKLLLSCNKLSNRSQYDQIQRFGFDLIISILMQAIVSHLSSPVYLFNIFKDVVDIIRDWPVF